ncbi:MAG: metalloregulator ArsR/SmtB family transcription factor [Gemmataceae bacterium]|nr:metalloregulator ArsR/SmtB family transcription factor [Gemmataceae bacterium]
MAGRPSKTDNLARAAEVFGTLAHHHRLRMAQLLLSGKHTVGALADACGVPSPVASGHLRLMQRVGLLEPERDGRNVYYMIIEPAVADVIAVVKKRFGKK